MATAEVGALRVTLGMDVAQFAEGANKAATLTSGLVAKLGLIAGVAAAAGAAIGNKLSSAIEKYIDEIKDAINRTTDIADAAKKFGLSISEVTAIVRDGGTPVETLTTGLEELEKSIFKVASGDAASRAARAFEAIGVSALDAAGKMRPVGDVVKDVADKFATYRDGIAKDALATDLFGEAGKSLTDVLSKGTAAMKEQADGGLTLGSVLADLYNMAEGKLKGAWDDLSNSFDHFLAALGAPTAKEFAATVRDWGKAALEALPSAKQITEAFDSLFIAALAVEQRIERLGANLAGFWRAAMALFTDDDVKAVNDQTAKAIEDIDARAAKSLKTFQALAAGWDAVIEGPKEMKGEQKDPPIIQATQKLTEAQRELNKQIQEGVNLAKQAREPYQVFADNIKALDAAQTAGKISAEQYGQAQRQAALIAVNAYAGAASSIGGSLTQVFKKSKGVAIAAAIINSFQAASNALAQAPWPLNFAAAAAALAAGFAQVANIRSTNEGGSGGGGGGASSGGGGDTAASAQASQTLRVEGLDATSLLSGDVVRAFAQSLLQFQADGGKVIL